MTLEIKFKTKKLSDIWFFDNVVEMFRNWNENNLHPHTIFHGPWGTGKSSIVEVGLREYFNGDRALYKANVTWRNGSQKKDSGVAAMDGDIALMRVQPKGGFPYRFIVYEEADKLSDRAKMALKDPMSKYNSNCKVIFITNHYSIKIFEELDNRCLTIAMPVPLRDATKKYINWIIEQVEDDYERVITEKQIDNIIRIRPSPRKVLVSLQAYYSGQEVDGELKLAELTETIVSKLFFAKHEKIKKGELYKETFKLYRDYSLQYPSKERLMMAIFLDIIVDRYLNDKPNTVGEISKSLGKTDINLIAGANPHLCISEMLKVLSDSFAYRKENKK